MLSDMADRMLAGFGDAAPSTPDCWRILAEQGILAVGLPEETGGFGSIIEQSLVHEALGRSASRLPVLGCGVLARDLAIAANGLAADVVDGSQMVAAALIEGAEPVVAAGDGDDIRLTGSKRIVLGAATADRLIVHAQALGASRLFMVEADADGVEIVGETLLDGSPAGSVTFANAPALALGDADSAAVALAQALDTATLLAIAELHGLAASAVDLTVEFVGQRAQFGRSLKEFQAVQHRLAEMVVDRHLVRSHLDVALSARQSRPGMAPGESFPIAVAAGRLALNICEVAIQLHGAMGMTDEYPLGNRIRRTMVLNGLVQGWERYRRKTGSPATGMEPGAALQ
ncbi:acyl-CoA dehydrogenase family protein [Pelagerythrobacter sp.]|uniref:acyl-CoA dehydrogenase family protein n=1 Tax=Pelagerythrobacter sp. TaxID=2800702 RepID=UPI0035B2C3A4